MGTVQPQEAGGGRGESQPEQREDALSRQPFHSGQLSLFTLFFLLYNFRVLFHIEVCHGWPLIYFFSFQQDSFTECKKQDTRYISGVNWHLYKLAKYA